MSLKSASGETTSAGIDPHPRLPFPVTFVCRHPSSWPELFADDAATLDPDEVPNRFVSNEDCWVVMTYLRLKPHHPEVRISDRVTPGGVFVASALDVGIRSLSPDAFVIGCRSDGPRAVQCDFSVVQNECNLGSSSTGLVPHWPQPGLIPRSASRGDRIENVTFKGGLGNLHEWFRSDDFRDKLAGIGVRLGINDIGPTGVVAWNDYGNDDLVLAARNLTEADARVKPASKLINAWAAGTPALLGPEPAFQALRRSEHDYIEVVTPDDALSAIKRLQDEPARYRKMVEGGLDRARDYTTDRMVRRWSELLAGPVAERYEAWKRRPRLFRLINFAAKLPRMRLANREAGRYQSHGRRIITGEIT